MRKCKITVFDYSDAVHGSAPWHYDKNNPPKVVEYNVEAWCVQGDCGFLAYWIKGSTLYTAYGDDGHWWLNRTMDAHWLPETVDALKALLSEYKETA
jgi:hypothetical protein